MYSCWLVGGIAVSALFVAIFLVFTLVLIKFFHTPRGEVVYRQLSFVLKTDQLIPHTQQEMSDITAALVRYQLKKQYYPSNLAALCPDYLPKKSELHSALDPVSDPNHLSFIYVRPSPTARPSTKVLSIKWSCAIKSGKSVTYTEEALTMALDGHAAETQYVDGKIVGKLYYNVARDND